MHSDYSTALLIQGLIERARKNHSSTYNKWCSIGTALAKHRSDARGHALEHLDGQIDLILRDLEADQLSTIQNYDEKLGGGVFFIQVSLSKMWLFSIYETVRMNCAFKPCDEPVGTKEFCKEMTCLRCKLRTVRDELSTFRVPLAKLEPESKRRGATHTENYQVQLVTDTGNGSVGWEAYSQRSKTTRITSRLALSNFILETLHP